MKLFSFFSPLSKTKKGSLPLQSTSAPHPLKLFPAAEEDIVYQFDIKKMKWIFSGRCDVGVDGDFYVLPQEYHQKAADLLDVINEFLIVAHTSYASKIPLFNYNKFDLNYVQTNKNVFDCCLFFYHPLDYQNKKNKLPYSLVLRFGNKNHSQLKIFYNACGKIERIHCVCWGKYCYNIWITSQNEQLNLYSAYKSVNGSSVLIFDRGRESYQKRKEEYDWICRFLPDLAPKTQSAYSRMKNSNSTAYQKIVSAASKKGKTL